MKKKWLVLFLGTFMALGSLGADWFQVKLDVTSDFWKPMLPDTYIIERPTSGDAGEIAKYLAREVYFRYTYQMPEEPLPSLPDSSLEVTASDPYAMALHGYVDAQQKFQTLPVSPLELKPGYQWSNYYFQVGKTVIMFAISSIGSRS